MQPYPASNSVLLMDNCGIHTSETLHEIVEDQGCGLEFAPPYSPDFNPIKESFSCGMYQMQSSLGLELNVISIQSRVGFRATGGWPRSRIQWPQLRLHVAMSPQRKHAHGSITQVMSKTDESKS